MHRPLASLAAALAALAAAAPPAQTPAAPPGRIHWYLAQQLDRAAPADELPVYFAMADRLGVDHWFPRVSRLHVDERRKVVVAELKAHAARTQQDLLDRLRDAADAGLVSGVRSNWLGNFVQCDATPLVVRALARLPGVAQVRYRASWPLHLVEDGALATAPAPQGGGVGTGPINTRSPKVWALGFRGQGVVAMNADTVAFIEHGDLRNRKWTNPGEIAGNGVDDDQNGYVDDVHGYNFFDDNNNIATGSTSHGTLTAGCMVADGTCSGIVTGEAPAAQVMYGAIGGCCPQTGPVNPAGEVAQWEAIQYAIDNGAHIQTSSHSYKNGFVPPPDYEMHRAVADASLAAGLIRCNSTSNNGAIANNATNLARIPFNVSAPGNVPPPYLDPNQTLVGRRSGVVGVGAHDKTSNQLVSYTPRGPVAWHLEDLLAVNPSYPVANWNVGINDYPWWSGARQGLLKPDVTGPTETLGLLPSACGTGNTNGTSTATPRVAGCMILWKCANMSLKPEDMAMIVHQSAVDTGSVPGKENAWGAGRVDALAGLYLALCVHRAGGEPAWSITHKAGTPLTLEVDTLPHCFAVIAPLTSRNGPPLSTPFFAGPTGPTGDVSVTIPIATSAAGTVLFTRAFTSCDGFGIVDGTLRSNVIEIRIVP